MRKGQSKAFLKALRRKYGLGEFKSGRKSNSKRKRARSKAATFSPFGMFG